MSKADTYQKKIWKGFGKAAKALGRDFDIYRSEVLTNPIQDVNWIDRKKAAFALDNKYGSAHTFGTSMWRCFVDGRLNDLYDIQQGDYLYDKLTGETFYIATAQQHLPIMAVKASSTISIYRAGYNDFSDGGAPTDTEVAVSIPCWIEEPSSAGGDLGYMPAASYGAKDSIRVHKIFLWDPVGTIQLRDAIVDQDNRRSQVVNIDTGDAGTVLTTLAYDAQS